MIVEDQIFYSGVALAIGGVAVVAFFQSRADSKDQIREVNFRARVAAAVASFLYMASTLAMGNAPGSWGLEWIVGAVVTFAMIVAVIICTISGAVFRRRLKD